MFPRNYVSKWVTFFNRRQLKDIMSMYTKNSIAITFFTDKLIIGSEEISEHYHNLMRDGTQITVLSNIASRRLGTNIYSGEYNLERKGVNYVCNFTFVFCEESEEPKIITHHTSLK